MAYITQSDLTEQLSNTELIQITDDQRLGIVDPSVINKAIVSAESEVNGYLATRYAVPVAAPVPDLVKKLSLDITIYNLYRRRKRISEDVRTAHEDALKKLEQIAKGMITLGINPLPAASTQGSSGEVFGPDRVFDLDKLGNF
jgi:phage gp36-like protein